MTTTTYRRYRSVDRCGRSNLGPDFCAVQAHPELRDRLKVELENARGQLDPALGAAIALARQPRPLGFNDGVIIPPEQFPLGTAFAQIRGAAAERAPLRGSVRVIVVLARFSDHALATSAQHYKDLFFSTGVLPHGSVKEYYRDVSGGLIDITGEVVGPFLLPQTQAWYANGNFGIGRPSGVARANIMARDAAQAANPSVNFGLYDNDGNGFVDAFIIVHPGPGGEVTGNSNDIWSHKWTLPSALAADGKQIFAYLTIPEDAKLGVCAHELGHLLFGFPDLYDTDDTSEGVGNWCLMSGGSWNGGGDIPSHPSAWCKLNQGWVSVNNVTTGSNVSLPDVKASRVVHRMWKSGAGGNEYFLLENRQRTGYDAGLPGDGLLIWHIDESQPGNTDENHYKVALMQADGKRDMELDHNRGDTGDPFPGSTGKTVFDGSSTPSSKSYGNQTTCVSVSNISASAATMSARLGVTCKVAIKEVKEVKELRKDTKELAKDIKDGRKETKELIKETKELAKERKDIKDRVEVRPPIHGGLGGFGGAGGGSFQGGGGSGGDIAQVLSQIESRLASLEVMVVGGQQQPAQPFIGSELRPDLIGAGNPDDGADLQALSDQLQQRMAGGDRDAKRAFDNMP